MMKNVSARPARWRLPPCAGSAARRAGAHSRAARRAHQRLHPLDHDSGRVLAEQRSDERMEPASITKLMTAYIVFEALKEKRLALTDNVLVSEHAWRTGGSASGGSTTFLEVGSQVPVEVLIKGMIVQSGNDATIALAEKLGGTEDGFVQMMNEYAKRLGLKGTHFAEQLGRPVAGPLHHRARPRDAVAARIIREFPEYYKLVLDARIHLEQAHAAEPQWPAGSRPHRRRHQDRPHREREVLPGQLRQAQRHAPDLGGAGLAHASRRARMPAPRC